MTWKLLYKVGEEIIFQIFVLYIYIYICTFIYIKYNSYLYKVCQAPSLLTFICGKCWVCDSWQRDGHHLSCIRKTWLSPIMYTKDMVVTYHVYEILNI